MSSSQLSSLDASDIFTSRWWSLYIDAWNASEYRKSLAGLGIVQFVVRDRNIETGYVYWDKEGHAMQIPPPAKKVPVFSADYDDWVQFLYGDVKAAKAVILGKIRFAGDLQRIKPYRSQFNNLAAVARQLTAD